MGEYCILSVSKISVQKDKFRTEEGQVISASEFWSGPLDEADVHRFKRAIVSCHLKGFDLDDSFDLIISLRSGFVKLRIKNPRENLFADHIAVVMRPLINMLYTVPGYGKAGYLSTFRSNDLSKYLLCQTWNADLLLGSLHDIREEGEFRASFTDDDTAQLIKKYERARKPVDDVAKEGEEGEDSGTGMPCRKASWIERS